MQTRYDAIVIGTGQSGPSLAVELSNAGRSVAVIERDRFGGTCVNTGCTQTKALGASVLAAHVARRSAEYGVVIGGQVNVDMKAVKARKGRMPLCCDRTPVWRGGSSARTTSPSTRGTADSRGLTPCGLGRVS